VKNTSTIGKIIGQNVERLRREAGLTQAEFGRRAIVSHPTICAIGNGNTSEPSITTVPKLTDAPGSDVAELVKHDNRSHSDACPTSAIKARFEALEKSVLLMKTQIARIAINDETRSPRSMASSIGKSHG
jgi:transcriptional regulator with XRE-family HTH domain